MAARRLTPSILALAAVSACTTPDAVVYTGTSIYQLAEFTSEGESEIYEIQIEPEGPSFVSVFREREESYVELGLRVRELDREHAARIGELPFSGLVIQSVDVGSPLDGHVGDILVSVAGKPVSYLLNYHDVCRGLSADDPVQLEIRPVASASASASESPPIAVLVRPVSRKRVARDVTRVSLHDVKGTVPFFEAGFRMGVIPARESKRIYGDDRHAIVITGVALGSRSYLAGLRAGDIIEKVDERPTPAAHALLELLYRRSSQAQPVEFEVVRGSGQSFVARVLLRDSATSFRAYVPAVCDVSSTLRQTTWSILPWGAMASYTNSYLETDARTAEQYGEYSILLGCFRYRWRPEGTSFRLLWLIDF